MTTSASHIEVVLVTFVCYGVYKYDPRYVIIFKVARVWEGYMCEEVTTGLPNIFSLLSDRCICMQEVNQFRQNSSARARR